MRKYGFSNKRLTKNDSQKMIHIWKFLSIPILISRQFAENELWPIAGTIDKTCEYPEQQILKMGELG